jgi:hypothetical protein
MELSMKKGNGGLSSLWMGALFIVAAAIYTGQLKFLFQVAPWVIGLWLIGTVLKTARDWGPQGIIFLMLLVMGILTLIAFAVPGSMMWE